MIVQPVWEWLALAAIAAGLLAAVMGWRRVRRRAAAVPDLAYGYKVSHRDPGA